MRFPLQARPVFIVVLALATLTCLSACGRDSYVGTWQREGGHGPELVIAATEGDYALRFIGTPWVQDWVPLHVEGDELVGTASVRWSRVRLTLSYDDDAQCLRYSDTSGLHASYTKLSAASAAPSPTD